ncbi:MAG: hypothetical protein V4724_25835 [Pseudomonadota bacterium]
MKPIILRALAFAAPYALATAACGADWSTTDVDYRYGARYNDNGANAGPRIEKHLLQVQNNSGFSLGRSYFFLLMSKADGADKYSGDLYSEGQATFSLSKLSGQKLAAGPLLDVGLTGGYNFGARNSAFGPNARVLLLGPTLDLGLPGFNIVSLDLLAYHDTGRYGGFGGGRLCGQAATTYQITPFWQSGFTLAGARFVFDGYADFIGAHGNCARQALTETQLRVDIGDFWGVRDKFYAGVEVQHWRNKFGTRGVRETVPQLVLRWRL